MAFTLSEVIPWGRSYGEYLAMFSLSTSDLGKSILGSGDGPASFNSILTQQNGSIVSVDPLYSCTTEQIQQKIDETYETVLKQTRENKDEFVWDFIPSVEALAEKRMAAMREFLKDYEQGIREKRYRSASLPRLPFRDNEFDIALCSHFLFLYSEQLSEAFHYQAIEELCRVAADVRIVPVLELGSVRSRHLDAITNRLKSEKYSVRLVKVAYEFQKGGNEMLKITKNSNPVNQQNIQL